MSQTDLIEQVRGHISLFTSQFSIEDTALTIISEDANGIRLTGTVSIFNVQKVGLTITGNTQGAQISATFPAGLTEQAVVGGKTIQSWIPDWLAGNMDLQALTLGYQLAPASTARLSVVLGEVSGAPLIELQGFKASQPELTLTLEKTTAEAPLAKAAITGGLAFAGSTLALACEAGTDGQWAFQAVASDIKLGGLVQQIATAAQLSLQALPGEFTALDIKQARFSFNQERQVDIEGQWPWGALEGYFQKGSQCLLAFAPDNSFQFANISAALSAVDKIKFEDAALIYCNAAITPGDSVRVVDKLGLTGKTLPAGLSLMGTYALPADLPGLKGGGKVVLKANIPQPIALPTLEAAIAFNGLDFGRDFSLLESFIQLSPADLSFGVGLRFRARLDDSELYFTGLGDIAAPATFGLVMYLEDGSIWKNPFGLPAVDIGELGLDVGADVLSPAPRPKLGIRGKLRIGPFQGEGAGMLNTANPIESLISAKMNELSFQQCVDVFLAGDVKKLINQLPAEARSFALRNAELTIVPKAQQLAGRQYDAGLRIKGEGTIVNLKASLDVNATYKNGISGTASVSPILLKQGDAVVFRLSGNQPTDPSLMSVDMTLSNLLGGSNPFLRIDGYAALLGIVSNTKVEISKQGFYLATSGKLFGKFAADLDVKGGDIQAANGMAVRAAMKNDLISFLRAEVQKAIDANTGAEQAAYRTAKTELGKAENYLRTTQGAVDQFNRQQDAVKSAQREADSLRRQAGDKKREYDNASFGFKKGKLWTEYQALDKSATLASKALEGAVQVLEGLKVAVDWGQREAAVKTVQLASTVVTGFETATAGAKQAGKWIVDKGLGGVIDIKSAEFEGKLDVLSGGKVSMQVNVAFLGNPYHAVVGFDFASPDSAVKTLASALLNNTAVVGVQATMAGQIGKGWA